MYCAGTLAVQNHYLLYTAGRLRLTFPYEGSQDFKRAYHSVCRWFLP